MKDTTTLFPRGRSYRYDPDHRIKDRQSSFSLALASASFSLALTITAGSCAGSDDHIQSSGPSKD